MVGARGERPGYSVIAGYLSTESDYVQQTVGASAAAAQQLRRTPSRAHCASSKAGEDSKDATAREVLVGGVANLEMLGAMICRGV